MPSSGSTNFTVNRDEIVTLAMQDCGQLGVGEAISPEDLTYCSKKLNMLVKQWMGMADFAPGLKLWSRKRADLFLSTSASIYNVGPTGDHWTSTYVSTTLTATAVPSATALTVSSITGISSGDNIGIVLDSGALFWTTVNGAPSGTTVNLAAGLTSQATSGAVVYDYANATTSGNPLQILTIILRDAQNNDIGPLVPLTIEQYESLPTKTQINSTGDPYSYYFESHNTVPGTSNSYLFLDCYPFDVTKHLHITYLSTIEDFDVSTDTPDYPQQWYRALAAQLAIDILPGFQLPLTNELKQLRDDAVAIARNFDPETTNIFFQCDAEDDGQWQ